MHTGIQLETLCIVQYTVYALLFVCDLCRRPDWVQRGGVQKVQGQQGPRDQEGRPIYSTFIVSNFKGRAPRKQNQAWIKLLSISELEALHRHNTENSKHIFPEKELRGLSPNFHIHLSVSDLYIPRIGLPILLHENMWTDPGGYMNGIFVAVRDWTSFENQIAGARFLWLQFVHVCFSQRREPGTQGPLNFVKKYPLLVKE